MSYQQIPVIIEVNAIMHYRIVGPSDTPPTPETGYIIDPEPIEISDVNGKFWIEFKIITS